MKLSPIKDKCVFCGLWGNIRTEVNGNEFYSTIQNTIQYHPFKDETEKEIDISTGRKWKQPNLLDDIVGIPLYDRDTVEISGRLPFTKSEYNQYKNKLLQQEKIAFVEKSLKYFNLLEYLNDYKPENKNIITKIKKFFRKL